MKKPQIPPCSNIYLVNNNVYGLLYFNTYLAIISTVFNFGYRYIWLHQCNLPQGMFSQSTAVSFPLKDSYISTMTRPSNGQVGTWVSSKVMAETFSVLHSIQIDYGPPHSLLPKAYQALFPWMYSYWARRLTLTCNYSDISAND